MIQRDFLGREKNLRGGLPLYRVKDYLDEEIKGAFYQSKHQKVVMPKDNTFKVETILITRGRGQNKQYWVK